MKPKKLPPMVTAVAPEAFRQDLLELYQRHVAEDVSPQEVLATAAFAVGMLIAFLPPEQVTKDEVMHLVLENIQSGNRHAVEKVIAAHGGRQ